MATTSSVDVIVIATVIATAIFSVFLRKIIWNEDLSYYLIHQNISSFSL